MSNQLILPQVNSNQVVETRMISGNRLHLSSILSVMAKAVNTCVHANFSSIFIFNIFAKISNKPLSCCNYGVLFVEF